MRAIDTEDTGIDLYHGAKPFFVTMCGEDGTQRYWEWDVNPLTREPIVPQEDIDAIQLELITDDGYVLHNAKFDVTALATLSTIDWPWAKTHDTLYMAHILASNQPKDLTALVVQYLGSDIQVYEDTLEAACREARRIVNRRHKDWKVARKGDEDMPSAKEKTWKYDAWLPRAVAKAHNYSADHPWWTVLRDYANCDSECTIALFPILKSSLEARGLWRIYEERRKLLPVIYMMEKRGVTMSKEAADALEERWNTEAFEAETKCMAIAHEHYDYTLKMPKGPVNKNLMTFCFGETPNPVKATTQGKKYLDLPVVRWTDNGNPSLDSKEAIPQYLITLDSETPQYQFVKNLAIKRSRDTGLSYMNSYRKFWLPLNGTHGYDPRHGDNWYLIHPSVNATGTGTLRFTVQNPNTQQVSKKEEVNLRECFGSAPGREWFSLDAMNVELRIPAYESGELELITLFEKPNDPPYYGSQHLLNFSTVYPDIWYKELREVGAEKVGPHCKKKYAATNYQWCKNGDFAIQYNCGEETADRTFRKKGAFKALKHRFSRLETLNQRCIKHANEYGYVETLPDRTVDPSRGYPLLCTRTEHGKVLTTIPLAYRTQGTAMWVSGVRGSIIVYDFLEQLNCGKKWKGFTWPGGYYLILNIHDELVIDCPKRLRNRLVAKECQRLLGTIGHDLIPPIPIPFGCEHHSVCWAKGVSV